MYIIHEENHSCLCVAETIEKGIEWLIDNDWLNGLTVGVDADGNEYYLNEEIDKKNKDWEIIDYVNEMLEEKGKNAILEWLENFGFYFGTIDVA